LGDRLSTKPNRSSAEGNGAGTGTHRPLERALAYSGAPGEIRTHNLCLRRTALTFVEAPESLEDLKAVPRRLKAPQLVNMVLGGKTPIIDEKAAAQMGFSLVLYANAALQGAVHGMQSTLSTLKQRGVLDERAVTSFAERQRLVDKQGFDLMEARYAAHRADMVRCSCPTFPAADQTGAR
jgi:hypothetical protein